MRVHIPETDLVDFVRTYWRRMAEGDDSILRYFIIQNNLTSPTIEEEEEAVQWKL